MSSYVLPKIRAAVQVEGSTSQLAVVYGYVSNNTVEILSVDMTIDMFDEQLDVRALLRGQTGTQRKIISTALFRTG
ncbi:hypothetical protein DFH07DRAFT_970279 [Mycena maculata]|uniref:Uncharacterized protein n=1 Tax=Mycena maculata TaxID=230809 RepID=A0AAD7HS56_9AGAR|nr:hypothetical protein DFH07DRAFT_970279 [Mycena maculata]